MALPIYFTGTVSVAAGGTVVTLAGGMWSGINVRQGDFISINSLPEVLITEVTDGTHLKISPWQGAAQTGVAYVIYQNYVGRVVGVAAAEDVGEMLEKLHVDGLPFIVGADEDVPDPSYGDEGQLAFKPSTGEWWTKTGGVWVPSAGLIALGYGGTSTSSVTIGLGLKTFTTQPNLAYNGARVRAASAANQNNYMVGPATYASTTLTINVDTVSGTGTFADWLFSVAGDTGAAGPASTVPGPPGPAGPPGASGSGSGNVIGPVGAITDRIAVFDGTTGTVIKDGGKTIAELLAAGGSKVTTSSSPPPGAVDGDLWLEDDTGVLHVYYTDSDSSQWLATGGGGGGGSGIPDAPNDGTQYARQSLNWTPVVGGGGGGAAPSTSLPLMNATPAAIGSATKYAREDHVHPSDTTRAAVSHGHLAADVTDFPEAVDDRVNSLLVAGSNITLSYNDTANTLQITSTLTGGGGGDVVGPSSSVADRLAVFNGTTGKVIKDGGILVASLERRNYIVNGSMRISQENGTTLGTALSGANFYPADNYLFANGSAGTMTLQQIASLTPGGSPNRIQLKVTLADAALAAGDYIVLMQHIEGARVANLKSGNAAAKTITLQFGVKAPAGTYTIEFRNGAANRFYLAEYIISGGEANTDVVKSVTLTLDTSGTWLTAEGTTGLSVIWCLMAGSTFQNTANAWQAGNAFGTASQFNFMATSGNTFELFDVGLYEGNVAPAYALPEFAGELLACKRYWQKTFPYATAAANGAGTVGAVAGNTGSFTGGSICVLSWRFPVPMSGAPTITPYNPSSGGTAGQVGDMFGGAPSLAPTINPSADGVIVYTGGTATLTPCLHMVANKRLL